MPAPESPPLYRRLALITTPKSAIANQILALARPGQPILIAGPTASGKSALALELAEALGGAVVNADALQVYSCWRVLTARPPDEDLARAPHFLYGHVDPSEEHSVGHWLRDVSGLLERLRGKPMIFAGGTGLYLSALLDGLADIPPIPGHVRRRARLALETRGLEALAEELVRLDPSSRDRVDLRNPARVQRAWEVIRATGKPLARWHAEQPEPLLCAGECARFVINWPVEDLNARIDRRFDAMVAQGALEECRAMLSAWTPDRPGHRAIGAPELIRHLRGETTLAEAIDMAKRETRRYGKRQRTWFRSRMSGWTQINMDSESAFFG